MNLNIPELNKNVKYLLLALLISALLYFLLPVSYYLFHSQVLEMINAKRVNAIKIETIQIREKKREIKEIKKRKKTKLKNFQKKFFARFDLDLSVLSSEGSEAGIIGSGFNNVIEEGEADIPPIKRVFFPPRYPTRAREEGIEATIVAKLLIDENGNVLKVRIIKTPPFWGFDRSVIEAAHHWKFEPAKLNNMPVKVWATQIIEFKL